MTQLARDMNAVMTVLGQHPSIFNPDTETKSGGWVSMADVYLRAGEGLGAAIDRLKQEKRIEEKMFAERTYLRAA